MRPLGSPGKPLGKGTPGKGAPRPLYKKGKHVGTLANSTTDGVDAVRNIASDAKKLAHFRYTEDEHAPLTSTPAKKIKSWDMDVDATCLR